MREHERKISRIDRWRPLRQMKSKSSAGGGNILYLEYLDGGWCVRCEDAGKPHLGVDSQAFFDETGHGSAGGNGGPTGCRKTGCRQTEGRSAVLRICIGSSLYYIRQRTEMQALSIVTPPLWPWHSSLVQISRRVLDLFVIHMEKNTQS
jgi:hypothetical protein